MFNTLKFCRNLYNLALKQRQIAYNQFKKSINYIKQQNELPMFRKEFPEFKDVQSQVLQDVLHRLDKAYINFFENRARCPRFKSRDRYVSFNYPQVQKSKPYMDGYIYLSKIGYIKVHAHRAFAWDKVKQIMSAKVILQRAKELAS
jgi:putative transposase